MNLSVLIPSRGRPELLKKAIKSLPPSRGTEFLVAVDEDDPELGAYMDMSLQNMSVTVCPRWGYEQLHRYYNLLAKQSKGRWLMLFNDDAVVKRGSVVYHLTPLDPKRLTVVNLYHPVDNLFPVISRPFYEAIGHYSLSPHVDSWVQQIGEATGTQIYIPGVEIDHFRDTMSDDTYRQSRQAVLTTAPDYNSEAMRALREIDIAKVKEKLKNETNNPV